MTYEKYIKRSYENIWGSLKGEFTQEKVSYFDIHPSETVLDFISFLEERDVSGSVLDVGCGNARNTIAFAQKGYDAYGTDVAGQAIKLARKHLKLKGVSVDLKNASVFNLPYPDNSFDIVIDFGCLHHLRKSEWNKYQRNILRVLKDKGYYYLYCFSVNTPYIQGHRRPKNRNWVTHGNMHHCHYFSYDEVINYFGKKFSILRKYEWTKDDYPERFKVFYMQKRDR